MVLCNEVTKWMKDDITQPPAEGVYVYGLYLEGAGWDRRSCKLIDSKPKVLFEMMPVIRIYAENNGEISFMGPLDGGRLFEASCWMVCQRSKPFNTSFWYQNQTF